MQYPSTELVLDSNGRVYHLGLSRDEVAETVLLVGDQGRVDLVASFFDSIEHSSNHREFFCKTGTYNGKRISVLSTGIGTDNIDITINELDALFNINLEERGQGCDLDYVTNIARQMKIDYALSNSFGFGGTNGTLIFKKLD